MKHLDPNDPRFTAKALGEDEAKDITPEAHEEFDALQSFADTLKTELTSNGENDTLTEEQKERVRTAIESKQLKVIRFPVWINAAAACLVLGLVGVISLKTFDNRDAPMTVAEVEIRSDFKSNLEDTQTQTVELVEEAKMAEEIGQSHPSPRSLPLITAPPDGPDNSLQLKNQPPFEVELPPLSRFGRGHNNYVKKEDGTDTYMLKPFVVEEIEETGYKATTTLAGSRLRTVSMDEGAATSVDNHEAFVEPMQQSTGELKYKLAKHENPRRILSYTDAPRTLLNNFRQQSEPWNRESYDRIIENGFKSPTDHPLSTFSIDVDTASYANMRRFLNNGHLPPPDAVRIEEMINYFSYDYEGPNGEAPFAVHVDSTAAPWNEEHRLVRIALQGEKVDLSERPDANLVFLIDVSGSMSDSNKLPLVQRSLNLLVDQLKTPDRIAVVVYAGASGLALPSTTANNKETIQHAISNLKSGGSTNGGAGIELAYSVAQKHFIEDGINRVILCTDGDFNVGTTDRGGLTRMIEEKARTGVFFSVLGFGMGNYQDASMEELSNKGNGNYGYVDSFKEARKVFVDEMLGTLYTIAKDVKIQVEFNPTQVGSYRLIGYENRILAKEDFNDDTKDAGEIGAGHRVTALYEIVPPGLAEGKAPSVDPLKYQAASESVAKSSETLTVKLRFKQPDEDVSSLIEQALSDNGSELDASDDDFRFATAVASFGMLLRESELIANMSYEDVLDLAQNAKGNDAGGLRSEFIELVEKVISFQPVDQSGKE